MTSIDRLISVMARLRDPETGCPWDVKQTFRTIAPYTIEEAYEVADAIERDNLSDLKEELGDLLLQVVFHARMAEEQQEFTFDDVAAAIADKLVRRHPHVFGEQSADTPDDVLKIWEAGKAAERSAKASDEGKVESVLDGVAVTLPALTRAAKIQKRMSRVGFDWQKPSEVAEKVQEELDELRAEIAAGDTDLARAELGDVLFTLAQMANHLDIEPETALRATTAKVERRFRYVEAALLKQGKPVDEASFDDMETLWQEAKRAEKIDQAAE